MMEFIIQNAGTFAVLLLVVLVVVLLIRNLIKKKREGKSLTCSCGCSSCPMSGKCHGSREKK